MGGPKAVEGQPQFRDHRTRLGRFVGDTLHLPPPNIPLRRKIAATIVDVPFPHEIIAIHDNAIDRAVTLMQEEGYGLIALFNHSNKRDPEEVYKDLMLLHPYFRQLEFNIPVGDHQMKSYMPPIANFTGLTVSRVFTPDSLKHYRNNRLPLPPKHQIKRQFAEYTETSVQTLEIGGVVLLAPQGGRDRRLRPFHAFGPIQNIVSAANEREFTKIAFLVIGVGEKNRTDYEIENSLLAGKTFTLEIAPCITLSEIEKEVTRRNALLDARRGILPKEEQKTILTYTIDDLLYETMLGVVPEGYRPEQQINQATL